MARTGRPSKYKPEFAEQAYKLCLLGATDAQLADFFEVNEATINRWKDSKTDFCEALKNGKERADAVIAESLFHRAKGYSHPEDKIFNDNGTPLIVPTTKHYPPDTAACIFWLKNRRKKDWREKHEVDLSGELTIVRNTFKAEGGTGRPKTSIVDYAADRLGDNGGNGNRGNGHS